MFKNFLIVGILFFLTNCTTPGTAFLGPVFTGATTKSIAQTSLSFSTNQFVRKIQETSKKTKKEVKKIVNKIEEFNPEIKSLNFYVSVKNLYLKDQQLKKKNSFFHR
tara:strand:- start:1036 stop:1356 length:321 start_codon:yes stop_codon:yes gene_type:complete